MSKFQTEQEYFWAGNFGNEYTERNQKNQQYISNLSLFSQIISRTRKVNSIIEFGANIGLNLLALKKILPEAELSAIEINDTAVEQLKKIDHLKVHHTSILKYQPEQSFDFVLIKGVLIHLNPEWLNDIYQTIYSASIKYVCIAEYYNPTPVEVQYRGHKGKLFKRDFAGEMMEQFTDLKLVDYGFVYHRDPVFPQDDITWFLLEKE